MMIQWRSSASDCRLLELEKRRSLGLDPICLYGPLEPASLSIIGLTHVDRGGQWQLINSIASIDCVSLLGTALIAVIQ